MYFPDQICRNQRLFNYFVILVPWNAQITSRMEGMSPFSLRLMRTSSVWLSPPTWNQKRCWSCSSMSKNACFMKSKYLSTIWGRRSIFRLFRLVRSLYRNDHSARIAMATKNAQKIRKIRAINWQNVRYWYFHLLRILSCLWFSFSNLA